jgi:hypothetical protein
LKYMGDQAVAPDAIEGAVELRPYMRALEVVLDMHREESIDITVVGFEKRDTRAVHSGSTTLECADDLEF